MSDLCCRDGNLMVKPLLTVDELAEALKVSTTTIRRLVRRGMPKTWVGESLRFVYAEVMAWLPREKPRRSDAKVRPLRKGVTYMVDRLKMEAQRYE